MSDELILADAAVLTAGGQRRRHRAGFVWASGLDPDAAKRTQGPRTRRAGP
jgi:hypothetical protein